MITFAGPNVSQANTTVCILDERGLATWRGSCATSPIAIAEMLATHASSLERVGLESGPLTPWLVHELRALELPVLCLDARDAQAAMSMQINWSAANDADGSAQIGRTGWYPRPRPWPARRFLRAKQPYRDRTSLQSRKQYP